MPKTYNELYLALRQRLRDAGVDAHALEARLIVAGAAGKTPEKLLQDLQLYASDEIEQRVDALAARRLQGEPAAYLVGRWGFYGLDLAVTPDVLIPRMDTEVLVDCALARLRGKTELARVLDLCTGSGCIGCAIASALPESRAVLADVSAPALAVARENIAALGLAGRVSAEQLDVRCDPPRALGSFDMIVSNPPYIRDDEMPELDASVRDYEPALALAAGADGLDFYRAIAEKWTPLLRLGGWMLLEVGEGQAPDVTALLRRAGLRSLGAARDTAGTERVVFGRK